MEAPSPSPSSSPSPEAAAVPGLSSTSKYDNITTPPWGAQGRSRVLGGTALLAQFYLTVLNSNKIYNASRFYKNVYVRGEKQGLLTVSNHISTVDDPSLFCAMLPLSFFFTEDSHHKNRWTMCAKEFCFKNQFLGQYFQTGKVLPIERGQGLEQPAMKALTQRLAQGDWVHIFPEGKLSKTATLGSMKWGTAKVLCDGGSVDPVVLPFYHKGLEKILPPGSKIPGVGRKNTILVGKPIDFGDLLRKCKSSHQKAKKGQPSAPEAAEEEEQKKKYYREIMSKIEQSLKELEKECQQLHEKH